MRKYQNYFLNIFFLAVFVLASHSAMASIVIGGTRVIYPADYKEVTIKVTNKGSEPVLIQSWIDNGSPNERPEDIHVPFILTPPINRIDPNKGQTLRMSYLGEPLPSDKESVFYLNVLEIPAKPKLQEQKNFLQVAFRSRIKVFYRPKNLAGNPEDASKNITWQVKGNKVVAENSSPYFVSLVSVTVDGRKTDGPMLPPKSTTDINVLASAKQKVQYTYVNDYGALVESIGVTK